MSESNFYHVTETGKLIRLASWAKALTAARRGGYAWLDYCEPTKEELSLLMKPLKLHPLAIEDCTDEQQIPKIDNYQHHSFMLLNAINYADHKLSIYEIDLFVGPNFVISVQQRGVDGQPLLKGVERTIEQHPESMGKGPAYLLHTIMDQIVDQKFVEIEKLEDEMVEAEEEVLKDANDFNPATLLHLRRDLLTVRKSLYYEREILVKISRKDCPYIDETALYRYRDIYDHLSKFFEMTESYRDVVTSLMEMYLSMLNNEMARAANTTNFRVRRLTLITAIFMPLSLLAGIGGMSEYTTMTGGPQNMWFSYPLFMFGMIIIGFFTYRLLQWLERRQSRSEQE
ncbi:MAG TPA: magnesium transporter CorA family protein [Anaerolineales bacterium]|nr:magnesium transporter CorA family protein [Anaerolineales bacterium]